MAKAEITLRLRSLVFHEIGGEAFVKKENTAPLSGSGLTEPIRKEVILAEDTLQILNVEKDRAEQAAHVPEKPLLLAFLQVLSGKLRLVVVVCHDDCQGCSILFVKHRNSDRISDTSYFQLR